MITSKPDIFEAVKEALHIVTCGLLPIQGTTAKDAVGLENGPGQGTPEHHSQNTGFARSADEEIGEETKSDRSKRHTPAAEREGSTLQT